MPKKNPENGETSNAEGVDVKPMVIKQYECMLDAIKAHGDTDKCLEWYRKYKPNYLKEYGIHTVQYSLSCSMMEHTLKLINDTDSMDKLIV